MDSVGRNRREVIDPRSCLLAKGDKTGKEKVQAGHEHFQVPDELSYGRKLEWLLM